MSFTKVTVKQIPHYPDVVIDGVQCSDQVLWVDFLSSQGVNYGENTSNYVVKAKSGFCTMFDKIQFICDCYTRKTRIVVYIKEEAFKYKYTTYNKKTGATTSGIAPDLTYTHSLLSCSSFPGSPFMEELTMQSEASRHENPMSPMASPRHPGFMSPMRSPPHPGFMTPRRSPHRGCMSPMRSPPHLGFGSISQRGPSTLTMNSFSSSSRGPFYQNFAGAINTKTSQLNSSMLNCSLPRSRNDQPNSSMLNCSLPRSRNDQPNLSMLNCSIPRAGQGPPNSSMLNCSLPRSRQVQPNLSMLNCSLPRSGQGHPNLSMGNCSLPRSRNDQPNLSMLNCSLPRSRNDQPNLSMGNCSLPRTSLFSPIHSTEFRINEEYVPQGPPPTPGASLFSSINSPKPEKRKRLTPPPTPGRSLRQRSEIEIIPLFPGSKTPVQNLSQHSLSPPTPGNPFSSETDIIPIYDSQVPIGPSSWKDDLRPPQTPGSTLFPFNTSLQLDSEYGFMEPPPTPGGGLLPSSESDDLLSPKLTSPMWNPFDNTPLEVDYFAPPPTPRLSAPNPNSPLETQQHDSILQSLLEEPPAPIRESTSVNNTGRVAIAEFGNILKILTDLTPYEPESDTFGVLNPYPPLRLKNKSLDEFLDKYPVGDASTLHEMNKNDFDKYFPTHSNGQLPNIPKPNLQRTVSAPSTSTFTSFNNTSSAASVTNPSIFNQSNCADLSTFTPPSTLNAQCFKTPVPRSTPFRRRSQPNSNPPNNQCLPCNKSRDYNRSLPYLLRRSSVIKHKEAESSYPVPIPVEKNLRCMNMLSDFDFNP